MLSPKIYNIFSDTSISGLSGHIVTSGCRSLSESFGNTFFDPVSWNLPLFHNCSTAGNSNMAAQTENTYISGTAREHQN